MKAKKYDGREFYLFLEKYLPKKVDYHREFNYEEEIDSFRTQYSESSGTFYMFLDLTTGKGYSSHVHRATYTFKNKGNYLDAQQTMYDRNHEAQLVRKVVKAFEEYLDKSAWPKVLEVNIYQELD